jgi:hypothetical protein
MDRRCLFLGFCEPHNEQNSPSWEFRRDMCHIPRACGFILCASLVHSSEHFDLPLTRRIARYLLPVKTWGPPSSDCHYGRGQVACHIVSIYRSEHIAVNRLLIMHPAERILAFDVPYPRSLFVSLFQVGAHVDTLSYPLM